MNNWSYAQFDDWVVVYGPDGNEVFQHHHPDWRDVFSWLGVELEDLGEQDPVKFEYHFPVTRAGFDWVMELIEERENTIAEKEAQIEKLREEIAKLGGMA